MSTWDCLDQGIYVSHIGWQRSTQCRNLDGSECRFFQFLWEDWSTKMHSFNGCDCLTDSYFDPPVVGEIDHLHWDQRSRWGKACESRPKWHTALLSHHFFKKENVMLLIKILNLDALDFLPKDIPRGKHICRPITYQPDVYTNLVLIMKHKY